MEVAHDSINEQEITSNDDTRSEKNSSCGDKMHMRTGMHTCSNAMQNVRSDVT